MKYLLTILAMWKLTSAQENCPGLKLSAGLDTLLGNLPLTNCAPELPNLPFLQDYPCHETPFLPSPSCLPFPPCLPSPPCLPFSPCLPPLSSYGECLPSLPTLPELGGCDYPYYGEPLPYLKKKCGCKPLCKVPKSCALKSCGLKECDCLDDCNHGVGLKIKPLITPFLLKSKKVPNFESFESLPCEIPSLVSGAFPGVLGNNCFL